MELNRNEIILKTINFYRSNGFFKSDNNLTDQLLLEKIGRKIKLDTLYNNKSAYEYGIPFYFDDLILLSYDTDRVWFKDIESNGCAGNDIYIKVLNEWSTISRNKFTPINIKENWSRNSIDIEFEFEGTKRVVKPKYLYDFIDITILKDINSIIKHTGYQFEIIALEQLVFICLLGKDEKEQLMAHRKIDFNVF